LVSFVVFSTSRIKSISLLCIVETDVKSGAGNQCADRGVRDELLEQIERLITDHGHNLIAAGLHHIVVELFGTAGQEATCYLFGEKRSITRKNRTHFLQQKQLLI
jgi:hypothetical protein